VPRRVSACRAVAAVIRQTRDAQTPASCASTTTLHYVQQKHTLIIIDAMSVEENFKKLIKAFSFKKITEKKLL